MRAGIVCYVLMYSGDCSVVMPGWVVGEGNVVNVEDVVELWTCSKNVVRTWSNVDA